MVMRYHLGLGVGHVYSHFKNAVNLETSSPEQECSEGQPDAEILSDELVAENASSTGSEVSSSSFDTFEALVDHSGDDSDECRSDDEEQYEMENMDDYFSTHEQMDLL